MTNPSNPADGGRTLPEDLAGKAGLPRQDEVEHSLHALDDRAGQATGEAHDRVQDAASDIRASGSETVRDAGERLGDTAGTLRERAADAYDDVRSWAGDRYDEHSRRAADLADRGYLRLRDGRTATEAFVADNPLLVGVVGLAAGLLLGSLLPRTRREVEAIGPWADEVRDQGLRYARDITHRGRAFVETALDPDNLERAARQSGLTPEDEGKRSYEGSERTEHRL